ncbi:hypothetical protein HYALB_00002491 [Hymenoscyphus albidus]|uniref:JmjC domain-containing protein n=1 Tax=Hymenoscyphus albidus TaxID=595503 RepID=A0A9N9Q4G2_9HELO|nr:hypothetical protein HYALB_00002491 [Hymenoscyphus albidus]
MAPQSHPQAQFVPIPPDFDLAALVDVTPNFDYVTRLSVEQLKLHTIQSFEALVVALVIQSGKPLIIEDYGSALPPDLFGRTWLESNLGTKPERVRDIQNAVDIPMSMGHYLRNMKQLTDQFSPSNYRDPKRQRLYLKDIDCPNEWANHLQKTIPESVYYLNECIESRTGGDGAIREPNEYGQMRYGKGVAPAGDLMSSLPPEMRAQNMMCYIGHEGTYTPAHREMCASLGQNIMVEASEDGFGEKAGSSIWFMTETKEREVVSEYFLSMLGHDIEVEKHFAQLNAWKRAPFNVWVVEQRVGDLILIPPLAPHQVWNRGTRTMKVAWNRTTVDTLELAIHEALPRAIMVCRDEQYKNKAIIYYTLVKYYDLLQRDTIEPKMWKYGRIKQVLDDFKRLFLLYGEILVSEMFSPKRQEESVEMLPYDSNVTCSYCRCNIFNRFLTCKSCIEYGPNGEEDTYDICMDCYAMGRSCACISNLTWVKQWNWDQLVQNYEKWRNIVVQADGFFDVQRSPQPLDTARKRYGRKPIAEVCQEQLAARPWNDIKNPTIREPSPGLSDVEPEVDDEGRPKNKKRSKFTKRKVIAQKNKTHSCHICFHHEWKWKLAFCTTCKNAYCYGVLWRAFDLMPQTVMEDKEWSCPKCLKICSCGKCRKSGTQKPYAPKGTLLGHDTKLVADFRSVESLVDFSKTNLSWLRAEGDDNPKESQRMLKLKEKAEADKARVDTVNESYMDDGAQDPFIGAPSAENHDGIDDMTNMNGIDPALASMDEIDPALRDAFGPVSNSFSEQNGHYDDPYDHMNGQGNDNAQDQANAEEAYQGQNAWMMDAHYDMDEYDSYNHQSAANYPSRLLAPEAPMTAPEAQSPVAVLEEPMTAPEAPMMPAAESYPDPSHVGQNRMMGIGYYQQGSGADRILFYPPDFDGDLNKSPQPNTPINSNMAFSDLIPQEATDSVKKRRRGHDSDEDLEFFTSKKQRKLAVARKLAENGRVLPVEKAQPKFPKREVQLKVYTDLGEDAVPIEDDEAETTGKRNVQSGMGVTGQPVRRVNKASEKKSTPRRSMRAKDDTEEATPISSVTKPKPRRKSVWQARKEALENGEELEEEETPDPAPRKRRGRPRKSTVSSGAIDLSSGGSEKDVESSQGEDDFNMDGSSEKQHSSVRRGRGRPKKKVVTQIVSDDSSDHDNGGVDLEVDNIFREPIEHEAENVETARRLSTPRASTPEVKEEPNISWHASPENPGIQIAIPMNGSSHVAFTPTKRGRGRPKRAPLPAQSPTPSSDEEEEHEPSRPAQKFLSLKEKLALKGKSAKIVTHKGRTSNSKTPGFESSKSTSTVSPQLLRSPTPDCSMEWEGEDAKIASRSTESATVSSTTPAPVSSKYRDMMGDYSSPPVSRTSKVSPAKKGPTIVRLQSSEAESEPYISDEEDEVESEVEDSASDSNASIPAVRASPKKSLRGGGVALRGRGGILGGRGRGRPRGRGRGRPSLH